MEDGLMFAQIFLLSTCVILLIVFGILGVLLWNEVMGLTKAYRKLADTIEREVNPTLAEIKKALEGINGLATGVDKQITAVKSSFGTAYNLAFNATSKFKGLTLALIGGLLSGYKLFKKNKK